MKSLENELELGARNRGSYHQCFTIQGGRATVAVTRLFRIQIRIFG